MPTQIIAPNITAAPSAEFTLAAGEYTTISLFGGTPPSIPKVSVVLQYKGSDGNWYTFKELNDRDPIKAIDAAGTFRALRSACEVAVGVDRT